MPARWPRPRRPDEGEDEEAGVIADPPGDLGHGSAVPSERRPDDLAAVGSLLGASGLLVGRRLLVGC
jgi:hypothetical protein